MIQRVQTLYLLAVVGLLTTMFFVPLSTVTTTDGELIVRSFTASEGAQGSLSAVAATKYLTVVLIAALTIACITIGKFKDRMFQVKMSLVNLAVLFGLQLYTAYSIYKANSFIEKMNETIPNYSAGMTFSAVDIFPLLAMVFTYLAYRAIVKDEALVRSLDRIR